MAVAGLPIMSWRDADRNVLSSIALQKAGAPSNAIPAGQTSDEFTVLIYNNFGGGSATGDLYDCGLAVYNDNSPGAPTDTPYEEPVDPADGSDPWLQVKQVGYGAYLTETITRGTTPGYSALPYKAIGGQTKAKIYVRDPDVGGAAPPEPSVGDTLEGNIDGTFFRVLVKLSVPVDTAVTQVAVGLWLEGNYVA